MDARPAEKTRSPMRLTPLEVCWLLEDCASHPMQFFLRLKLSGSLDRRRFESALGDALARHPLLNSKVQQTGRCRWVWKDASCDPMVVDWIRGNVDELPHAGRIDIEKERGLRVTVIENQNDTAVVLQVQHTVCDGLSAADFAGDLLTAYANQVSCEKQFKFKRLDENRLLDRSSSGLSRKEKAKWLIRGLFSLNRFRRFYKRRPMMLVSRRQPEEDEARELYPEGEFCRFSREESIALQKRAQKSKTTINSLFLANMFAAFSRWRKEYKPTAADELLRITMPVSMRSAAHRSISASNIVSLVCFDRQVGTCEDDHKILEWVDQEIENVKVEHRGLILPFALKLLQWWPNQLARGIRRKRFSGTVLISNLGPVLTNCHLPKVQGKITIGELTVENIEFLPVLRPAQCITIAASTYAGRITLGMHYDSRMISAENAKSLFDQFLKTLMGELEEEQEKKLAA